MKTKVDENTTPETIIAGALVAAMVGGSLRSDCLNSSHPSWVFERGGTLPRSLDISELIWLRSTDERKQNDQD